MGVRKYPKKPPDPVEALRRCEDRLKSVLDLSSDWYWEQDENLRFTHFSGRILGEGGIDSAGVIGKTRWEISGAHAGVAEQAAVQARMDAREPFRDFEYRLVGPDGKVRHISASGLPAFDDSGAFKGYHGVAKDITERKRAEQLQALEHAVNRSIAEAVNAAGVIDASIRAVCETEGWECGRYFRVDEKAGVLRFGHAWGMPEPAIQQFIERSRAIVCQPGVGLMGRAWQSGQPLWVADVNQDARAKRTAFTDDLRIRGGFVFPVLSEGKTIGVLVFNSRESREPEERLLQAIHAIGSQIGQFLQRKRAEEEQRQFRLALDNSADMIVLIERATMRFVDVNETVCKLLGYSREELLTMGPQDLLPVSQGELEQAHDELIANPSILSGMRSYFRCRDGSTMPFESIRHVLRSGDSYIIAAICRDIRERLAAEEAQRQQVEMIRQSAEKDRLLRLFYDLPFVGLAVTSPGSKRWLQVNDYMCEMLGYPREELLELAWTEITHPDDLAANLALFQRLAAGEFDAFQFDKRFLRKDGGIVDTTMECRCVRRGDGSLETVVIMVRDITEKKRAEAALRESEARFRSLTQLSSDMYWEQDDQYRFTSLMGVGSERVNVSAGEPVVGMKRWELKYINMNAEDWSAHISTLEAHQPFHELELCREDEFGKKVWISVSGEPVFDASGAFKGYRGVGKDITGRKQGEEHIQYLANHDALTSLPNRAMFSEVLDLEIQQARRYERTFALMFIDLDRFKVINDTLGHEAGDALLQEIAKRLTQALRSSDVIARLGGDEFVVLVQEVSEPEQVEAVARKILSAVVKPVFISGQECRVTTSIGICMFPADAQDEPSLMKNADIAMYRAKEEGKNTYQFFSHEMNVHSFERMALETSLRHGLERSEFFLHYQAKLDLKTRQITGAEALVRWQHPDLGMIPPAQFIPLAEETGLIVPLGKWVLNTACAQNVAWQHEGLPPLCMAVNLSTRQFTDENLFKDIAEALETSGMKAELLELELTESTAMQNAERGGKVLAALKQLGVRLAIDDFGVGYSSLANLKHFPIDTLKVDRSFIRGIPQDSEDKAITRAIIAMGKNLNLTVVAEGVETLEQEMFLCEHACDETQGYYFSKPIAGEEFAALLRRRIEASK